MPEIVKNTEMSAMTLYAKGMTVPWISAQATDDPSRRISNRTSRLARSWRLNQFLIKQEKQHGT